MHGRGLESEIISRPKQILLASMALVLITLPSSIANEGSVFDTDDGPLATIFARADFEDGPTVQSRAAIVWTSDESDPLGLFYMDEGWTASITEVDGHSFLYFHNADGVEVARSELWEPGLKFRIVDPPVRSIASTT